MSSKKLLFSEIDQTKMLLSDQMSHQKTTLKEFQSFFKDYQAILKSTIEQLVKLTRKAFTCREYENKNIKGIIDNGIIYILRISDILGIQSEQIVSLEQEIYNTYIEIKQNKETIMGKCDTLKKERDQLISNKSLEQLQIESFSKQALSVMQQNVDAASKSDQKKNKILICQYKQLLKENQNALDQMQKSIQIFMKYIEGLNLEEPVVIKNIQQKPIIAPQINSITNQTSLNSPSLSNNLEQDYLTSHKDKIIQIRKKFNLTHIVTQLPLIIKEQIGIFSNSIPNNLQLQNIFRDIAKEFQQQEFYYFTLLLMQRYKSQQENWVQFITHTKNKFKINLQQMKQLEILQALISNEKGTNSLLSLSVYANFIRDTLIAVKDQQTYVSLQNNKLQLQLVKQIILFSMLNNYWANIILVEAFSQQTGNTKSYTSYFTQMINDIIFNEKNLNELQYSLEIEEISFPLNQCLLELILSGILESQSVDIDYLPLIYQFSQDVLKLTPAHCGVTLLSLVYQKILAPALRIKTLDIKEAIFTVETLTTELWKVIQQEKSINQSQMQKIMKLKNCDKLQRDLYGLIINFWSLLPSDKQFLKAFINLYYILNSIVIEHFSFQTMNEFLSHTLTSTGHSYYQMISKREQFSQNKITNQSLGQISQILQIIFKECIDLKETYIDTFADGIKQKMTDLQENQIHGLFFQWFMEGVLSEISILLEQIEVCQAKKMISEDSTGNAFVICFLLAQLDDTIAPYSILSDILKKIGTSLEIWFQNSQLNTFNILKNLISKETFVNNDQTFKEQLNQTQTKSVEDFCSILFKSIEALQQVYKLKSENIFKKLIYTKMESVLYQAILMYIESLEYNVKQWAQIYVNIFPILNKSKQNYVIDQQKLAQQQIHLSLGLMMRISNINFLEQQFQNLKEQLGVNLAEHLISDFRSKGKSICKYIGQIIIQEIFQANLFQPMHQDLKLLNDSTQYQNTSEWSIKHQIDEISDFFTIFNSKLPTNYSSLFYDSFIDSFFEKLFFSLFDINKLQNANQQAYQELLILELNVVQQFLQKHINGNVLQMRIKQKITEFKDFAQWFGVSNQDLIKIFQQQHQENKQTQAAALYRIMLLRKQDSKLKDTVKKYSKIYE